MPSSDRSIATAAWNISLIADPDRRHGGFAFSGVSVGQRKSAAVVPLRSSSATHATVFPARSYPREWPVNILHAAADRQPQVHADSTKVKQ
jgi:hypothetical protein